jgi:very-short-patch-repair endonuclease
MKKLTTNEFIKKSKEIHDNKYDYSLVVYNSSLKKVKIICPIHGVFQQTPSNHYKCGCKKCSLILKSKKLINKDILSLFKEKHGNFYDYSLVKYINNHTKIKIICPEHGIFEQIPKIHLRGSGCPKCSKNNKMTTKDFIHKAKKIHGNRYDYSLVDYKNTKTKVKIICPEHGIFEQIPNNHISKKYGCPFCNDSHGEKEIAQFLEKNNINFIRQYKFDDCKNIRQLPFDFHLPHYNICIEYDGEQHFRENKIWGSKSFEQTKIRDKIKNEYCEKNNIHLIRIRYDENICEKLNEKINNRIIYKEIKNNS